MRPESCDEQRVNAATADAPTADFLRFMPIWFQCQDLSRFPVNRDINYSQHSGVGLWEPFRAFPFPEICFLQSNFLK